ncbi:Transglutaminase-like superfamily protein [Planctomycetes bacterium MalM25]|nr:Transglutaminase-like superfamily protein [Planctomycetes bacterium MalM25]
MSSRSLSQIAILALLLIGGIGLIARYSARQSERLALEDSLWRLTYNVEFQATAEDTVVRFARPADGDRVRVESIGFTHSNSLKESRTVLRPSGTRLLQASTSQTADKLWARIQFLIRLRPSGGWGRPPMTNLSGDARARYLREERTVIPIHSSAVQEKLRAAEGKVGPDSKAAILHWIFEYCSHELPTEVPGKSANDTVLGALKDEVTTPLGKARLMVTLCRARGIPARLVTGFELKQQSKVVPHTWVEVFEDSDSRWWPFDPHNGHTRRMPESFVPVRIDGEQVVWTRQSAPAENLRSDYSIVRDNAKESIRHNEKQSPSVVFDLTRLPIEMHEVLALLLLLPLGALITAFFRNIVGIPTFGTFAPALFAVSFIYADWDSGLVILAVVLAAGLAGRAVVGRLRLLMVPRLSIILTTIILCVVFGVSALDYINWTPSANAVLLPLVIVTILIERFYVTTEEDGAGYAAQLAAGTVCVSAVCYLVLGWDDVGKAILVYPEAHLITIALFIAIGRYAGYRLIELWRFRDLVNKN